MKIDTNLLLEIAKAVVLLFIGGLVTKYFERRSKLIAYFEHVSVFKHTPPEGGGPCNVFTHSVILRNIGSEAANNVRIHHANLPNFHIWPEIVHNVDVLSSGGKDIVIPVMVPKEQITISYLYFPPLIYDQINAGIKCDQGFAKQIEMILQPKIKAWLIVLVWTLIITGVIALGYLSMSAFNHLQLKAPS